LICQTNGDAIADELETMKNILITGGAGFIGSNLALKLIERGYDVTVLDNLSPQIHGSDPQTTSPLFKSIKDVVRFIEGTVTSRGDLEKAIAGQDAIVHLAAETGTGQSMYQIEHYCNVNVQGTAILLDLLTNGDHNVSKIVVASSRAVYGEGKYLSKEYGVVYPGHRNDADMLAGDFEVKYKDSSALELVATDEESKVHPSSIYGITKQLQEQLVLNVAGSLGIGGVAFRYQNVYGPGQSLSNPYTGILSIFSNLIRLKQPINIFEDGKESRDFVFIDDTVAATIAGLESAKADGKVFNVGTGAPTTVLEAANALMKHLGIEVPLEVSGLFRKGDIRHNYADTTQLSALLKFVPAVSFDEGIKRFVEWVKTQPVMETRYRQSLDELKEKGLSAQPERS
jgi:dTDP-L-rhamnose 4-epimerase